MLTDGHYRLHRSTFAHPVVGIARPLRFALWQWMIGEAYFKDSGEMKRGQFMATNEQLATVGKMPLSTFRAFKAELVAAGMVIVSRPTSKRAPSVWTICNYDRFQSKSPAPKPAPKVADNLPPAGPVSMRESGDSKPTPCAEAGILDVHLKKEKTRSKKELTPASAEPPVDPPKKEKPKPSVKPIGGWPGIEVDQDWTGYPFPAEFKAIWAPWLLTQKRNKHVKAIRRRDTYRLILNWLHEGLSPADILRATQDYLRDFWNDTNKSYCEHPTTFYSHAHPVLPDRIAAFAGEPIEGGETAITDRWHNSRDAWRECASLSTHLGLEFPDVPKRTYGAEWEDVEKFHPLIVEFATDRSGFKEVPDDLAARIQGGE